MSIEEQLKQSNQLLKELLSRSIPQDIEESKQVSDEIENIEESIEKYEVEVEQLKQKLANKENYKRNQSEFELKERPVIESLINESISVEREDIFKSNIALRKQQEHNTKMLGIYNNEIIKLKEEIKNIEARLNKDSIAKKRGIAKKLHLSDSEVVELELELYYKKELIETGNQTMEICADEIRKCGSLITENNARLNAITEKEQKLLSLLDSKKNNEVGELDNYKIRLDQDELSKKISGLEALKRRKEFLLYNPSEEIKNQIRKNEEFLESLETKSGITKEESFSDDDLDNEDFSNSDDNTTNNNLDDNSNEEQNENNNEKKLNNESNDNELDDNSEKTQNNNLFEDGVYNDKIDNIFNRTTPYEEAKEFEPIPKERAIVPVNPETAELVEELDAPENLKRQKLSDRIKTAWKDWRTKAIAAAVAAAITITSAIGFKKEKPENNDSKIETETTQVDNTINSEYETNDKNEDFTFENGNNSIVQDQQDDLAQTNDDLNSNEPEEFEKNDNDLIQDPTDKDDNLIEQPEHKEEQEIASPETSIPEVEVEKPSISENDKNQIVYEGVINNSEIETTILSSEGEFVEIPLENGETVYVQYGDNAESVSTSDIVIKYVGTDMYIYSPIVNTKTMK